MAFRKYGVVYTPERLALFVAKILYDEIKNDKNTVSDILDPACGECALLNAAESVFGSGLKFWGIDVDPEVYDDNSDSNRTILINDSILPKNVKKNTDVYWKSKIGKVSAIIANPPWSSEKIYDKEKLNSAGFVLTGGQYDSYVLFIELAFNLLEDGGYFAFILPDSIFDAQNLLLRKFLIENTELKVIARLGEKIFDEVNRATTVFVCKKGKPSKESRTKCFRLSTEERKLYLSSEKKLEDIYNEQNHLVYQSRFAHNENFLFDIDTREDEEELLKKIKTNCMKWQDCFVFGRGVEISKAGKVVYCPHCGHAQGFKKKQLQSGKKDCTNCGKEMLVTNATIQNVISDVEIENSVSIYVGENIRRYNIDPGNYILTSIPGINYKDISMYNPPKLLVRKTGLGIYAAVDYSGGLTSQTVYILKPKDSNSIPLEYYLAILNSRVVYYYYLKVYGENEWKSHPYLTKQIIFSLPVATYDGSGLDIDIINLAKRLMNNYDYNIDMELERKIFAKYKLSEDEIQLLANEINKLPDLSAVNNMKFEVDSDV